MGTVLGYLIAGVIGIVILGAILACAYIAWYTIYGLIRDFCLWILLNLWDIAHLFHLTHEYPPLLWVYTQIGDHTSLDFTSATEKLYEREYTRNEKNGNTAYTSTHLTPEELRRNLEFNSPYISTDFWEKSIPDMPYIKNEEKRRRTIVSKLEKLYYTEQYPDTIGRKH